MAEKTHSIELLCDFHMCAALVPHLTYILLHIMVINKTSAFKKRKEAKAHDSVGRESVINTNNYAVRRLIG